MKSPTLSLLVAMLVLPSAALRAAPIEVKVDAAQTGAPINPFIYGQFIEHMGRCIYGGIWAEMLEDRKFYFPITEKYAPYRAIINADFPGEVVERGFPVVGASPWQIIGDASAVSMVKEGAFVGNHSPRVNAGAGLRQRDLGVKAGLRYDGYVWAKPLSGAAEIEVTLVWGEGAADRASTKLSFQGNDYSKQTFALTPAAGSEKGALLELRVLGGDVLLGPPSIMPSDNFKGMRRDTLALLKQLKGTVYRWPGGNFVSGYDWRDGIGDRDRRPPRKNPAWTGVEHNDFGTDEFMVFAREIGTEPMIAANTGFGDAYSAAQWVEYTNGSTDTVAGGWRAKNGNAQPYGVKYWCVGNEMFGPWQLGFMQMQHYTLKHNEVAQYMWKVDPTLQLVAVGDLTTINKDHDPAQVRSGKTCSHIMLEECAEHMNYLSEHFYVGRTPWSKNGRTDVATHVGLVREAIRAKADGHRKLQASLPNLKGKLMPVAMDEWNYWHREYAYGELGCVYELQDGLGIAAGLHEFFRQSDLIQMAHYAQTVNVIGAIKTSKVAAEMETTGLVLQLYREKFGQTPLIVTADASPADVMAALTQDGKTLTVGVVNPGTEAIEVKVTPAGMTFAGPATRWHISGPTAESHNSPGKPRVVDIQRTDAKASLLQVPALSAAVFELPLK
ncbi:Intracellular exo-alpha-(1-_5)-L-arabinofuranosidase 1 [Lacunisphaera limnophila]|uniref:non-reducing end alpha-L-arabinofuranosidase n=1 Tax=Lacunisphaera limnophila TaxID=1838286 RepID=A0A1D8AZN7_9BACT|nr:alpha-L-arabinofuranosidase C-terminal domain-containing protein [Lacunisphaera limnophila]AOS46366.1 Intracellular exo-alpha-(1->5)-L-arabinofuranosidase 1 [Lacunisphaera limnophila]